MAHSSSSKTFLPGAVIDGRFLIEREVGSGGMGVVFRAIDRLDGAAVALKVLFSEDAPDVDRFDREAAILAQLRHPGVARYVAYGACGAGEHYIAMEWLEGEDLAARIKRQRLTVAEGIIFLLRTVDALAIAHARGVIHRDLKPSNFFLVNGDIARVKVLDFGIAQRMGADRRRTRADIVVGTPGYMAPEQIEGSQTSDPRLDMFSLGCVIFECLAGRPAFEGGEVFAVLSKILLQDTPHLRGVREDVPEPLDNLVTRMLAKNPEERPRDAMELASELSALFGDLASAWAPRGDRATASMAQTVRLMPVRASGGSGGAALTRSEQRLVSVILAGDAEAARQQHHFTGPDLEATVETYGGRVNVVAGQWMLVTTSGAGSAVDWVERAARCALRLRARFADVPMCVATGRGLVSGRVVEGEVIDCGVNMLRATPSGAIRLDSCTADMLSARFLLERDGDTIFLRGERAPDESAPLLLGKPTVCLGRARELSTLEGVFMGCVEEQVASAVLVTGPAGAGKSRLRTEFIARLRQRRESVEILVGYGGSLGPSSPFGMIASAIRTAAGIREGESVEVRREKLVARLGRRLSGTGLDGIAGFLGEMTGTPFPDDDDEALSAARADAMLMGDAMRAAWEDWLTAECRARPVLLVLEDLHWGDVPTVRLVDSTLRNLRDLPFMVLVLARPEVHTRFPDLWSEREVQSIKLGPLSRKTSEALVRSALGGRSTLGQKVATGAPEGPIPELSDSVVAQVLDRADGNPFYLEELVRAVAAGRAELLPGSVLAIVEARLDAEGSDAKRMLRAASVFGDRFSAGGVAALLGGDRSREESRAWLETLAVRELVAPVGASGLAGDVEYVFCHALVREAVYATLTEADRALGHRLAGAWLERTGCTDALAMAEHFRRGGEPVRSVRWYRRAAEQALEANDLDAALERVAYGVEAGAAAEDLGALRLVEAEAHIWRGELALGEKLGLEAVALFGARSVAWFRAASQAIIAAGKLGGFDRVESWAGPVSASGAASDARSAQVMCRSWCATYLIFGGRYAAADALMASIGAEGPLHAQALALLEQTRSIRASAAGDPGACLVGLEAALAAYEHAGDRRNTCVTHVNLGFVFAELGDFEGAEEALRIALTSADRMGLRDLTTAALHNLGRVLAYRGLVEEARRLELRAVEEFRRRGDPRLEGSARAYLAQIELLAGDVASAEREARGAAETLRAAPPLRAVALAVLARALLQLGRGDEAMEAAREALSQLETLGEIEEGESLVRLVYAQALQERGAQREFAAAISTARVRLLARAERISDLTWRARFLADVPDNAQTLALAGA